MCDQNCQRKSDEPSAICPCDACRDELQLEDECPCEACNPDYVAAFIDQNEVIEYKESVPYYTGHERIDEFLDDCFETMRAKGHDYRQGNDDDILHNFRNVAQQVGSTKEKVWFTYFYKHYAALTTYIKNGGQSESEPIEGRIKDMIVYLLLFHEMVQQNIDASEVKETK